MDIFESIGERMKVIFEERSRCTYSGEVVVGGGTMVDLTETETCKVVV
jgi:hypothetical protein